MKGEAVNIHKLLPIYFLFGVETEITENFVQIPVI